MNRLEDFSFVSSGIGARLVVKISLSRSFVFVTGVWKLSSGEDLQDYSNDIVLVATV